MGSEVGEQDEPTRALECEVRRSRAVRLPGDCPRRLRAGSRARSGKTEGAEGCCRSEPGVFLRGRAIPIMRRMWALPPRQAGRCGLDGGGPSPALFLPRLSVITQGCGRRGVNGRDGCGYDGYQSGGRSFEVAGGCAPPRRGGGGGGGGLPGAAMAFHIQAFLKMRVVVSG